MTEPVQRRPIGIVSATSLVVASMIGAGVFTTSGYSLAELGSPTYVMWAWVVGGFVALCGALSYGGLARHIAESGGEYLFLSRVVHPAAGFIAGWISLLAGFTGAIAFAATAFEMYAVPQNARPAWLPEGYVALSVIMACGLLHAVRVRVGVAGQNAIVAAKMLTIAGFLGYAWYCFGIGNWPDATHGLPAKPFSIPTFCTALVWISLSYSGFNAAVYIASEVTDAARVVPAALWWGTCSVIVVYLALNLVFVTAGPFEAIAGRGDVAAVAAKLLGGPNLETAMRAIICLSLLSSVSAMVMAGPRVYAKMAADGVFPKLFSREAGSPRAAIGLQVLLAGLVVMAAGLNRLLSYLGFALSISAALTVCSLFILQRRHVERVPGYPAAAVIYVSGSLILACIAASHQPYEFAAAILTIVTGGLVYLACIRRREDADDPAV